MGLPNNEIGFSSFFSDEKEILRSKSDFSPLISDVPPVKNYTKEIKAGY